MRHPSHRRRAIVQRAWRALMRGEDCRDFWAVEEHGQEVWTDFLRLLHANAHLWPLIRSRASHLICPAMDAAMRDDWRPDPLQGLLFTDGGGA